MWMNIYGSTSRLAAAEARSTGSSSSSVTTSPATTSSSSEGKGSSGGDGDVASLRAQLAEMKSTTEKKINEAMDKRARELTTLLLTQFNARLKKETDERDEKIAALEKRKEIAALTKQLTSAQNSSLVSPLTTPLSLLAH
jgi:hypothetical protein